MSARNAERIAERLRAALPAGNVAIYGVVAVTARIPPDDDLPPCEILEEAEDELRELAARDEPAAIVAQALLVALENCQERRRSE